jgi:methylenetetrahydrofolate reductase (NADPH)
MEKVAKAADRLRPWFDAVNSTDNAAAHAHASNLAVAIAIKQHGLEPVMQIAQRDKNRLAVQADIMGAALHGIENIALMTGDDVTAGDEPETRRVFDLDGPIAIKLADILRNGTYLSGRKITPPPTLFISAVENPGTHPLEYRVDRAIKKQRAGARWLQLQLCFHKDRLENFCKGVAAYNTNLPLFPNVILIKGAKGMQFMNENVRGINIPQELIERVASAADPSEEAYQLTLELAKHALAQPSVRGLHITDFRHDDTLERLMTDLGRKPKY